MILLVLVRRGFCEVCGGSFDLTSETPYPETCPHCGSKDWRNGPESKDSKLIRMGLSKKTKRLNPGAKSRKRQERGRNQWRRFKPKPPEEIDVAPEAQQGDN